MTSSQKNSNRIMSNDMSHKLSVTDASFDNGPQMNHQQIETSGFEENSQYKDGQKNDANPYD